MGKDPAYLYYYRDIMASTYTWDDAEFGAYQRALNFQADTGHMQKKDLEKLLSVHWDRVSVKFDIDTDGLYYNKRLDEVMKKRSLFCNSRRQNRTSVKHMNNTCESSVVTTKGHMGNGNVISINEGGTGETWKAAYKAFREAYPKNGSAVDPNIETWFYARYTERSEDLERVAKRAKDYDDYCHWKEKAYPYGFIKQAINWLTSKQYEVDWVAKLEVESRGDKTQEQIDAEKAKVTEDERLARLAIQLKEKKAAEAADGVSENFIPVWRRHGKTAEAN